MSKLENLILEGFFLDKNALNNIGGIKSLKIISLSRCGLSGILPQGIYILMFSPNFFLLSIGIRKNRVPLVNLALK